MEREFIGMQDEDMPSPESILDYAAKTQPIRSRTGNLISNPADLGYKTHDFPRPNARIIAVIPAYNEDRFIGSLILKTRQYVDHVIVIDDGSSDNTAALANVAGAEVLVHQENLGKGAALKSGFGRAREQKADIIVMLDADGQHRPREIPNIIHPLLSGQADIVIGSRFMDVRSDIPAWRKLGQHTLTAITNYTSGVPTTDSQSGFRAINARALKVLDFQSNGFSVESEMQFIAREHNLRVVEAPISCLYVEKPKRNPFRQGLQVLNGIMNLVSQARPLFFFGFGGLILTLLGVGWWGLIVDIYSRTGLLAIGYALAATMLIIVGTLTAFQGITLHTLRQILRRIPRSPVEQTPFPGDGEYEPQEKTRNQSDDRRSL